MSLRTAIGGLRTLTTTPRVLATAQAEYQNNGDPGPNAAKFRKSQRKALREGKSTQALGSLQLLDGLMDPEAVNRIPRRSPRPPREGDRTTRSTGGFGRSSQSQNRPNKSRFEPAGIVAPDAYGTSVRLRKAIQPRSGAMTAADIDRAIKLVTDSPKSALSTPVWNMLLGMIGREGRLELMWKTFNDVSDNVLLPRAEY